MSIQLTSSLFGVLKTNGVSSSKVAVLAALVVGVEEYYFSRICKFIQKRFEKSGKEYECYQKEKLNFAWSFDDSGLYAAAVHKSHWYLSIIIYDYMDKKAYEYLKQFTWLKPDYFYWLNGDLVLIYISQDNFIQQIQIKIDHENREAEVIKTRNYDFPFFISETDFCYRPYIKNVLKKPLVECVETAVFEREEYILLISLFGSTIIMIPKDPNSTLPMRHSIYLHPLNWEIWVTTVYAQDLPQMCHRQFLYYPKMDQASYVDHGVQKYILDEFIEVNLEEQKDVNGKQINERRLWTERNHSGKSVPFSHVGTVPKDNKQLWTVITAKRFGNGKVLAVVEDLDRKRRYSCLIDAKKKQITWRKWQPKIQRKSNMILSSLHPSGYFIEIDYKKKQEDDKYKLFSKIVAHPNEPIKLKTMSFVNLLNTNRPIQPEFSNYIRRLL